MAKPKVRSGRPVWLELNAQRVTAAAEFYRGMFGWTYRPLHVAPWGSIPMIENAGRVFGTQFMAMGAFAHPRWIVWFSGDLERAEPLVKKLGGDTGRGIHQLGSLGELLDCTDPQDNGFALIRLREDPPEADAGGEPCMAEFWGREVRGLAEFYGEVIGLECKAVATGAMLGDKGAPRLFLRETPFDIQPPRWIPYFRSASVGGDCERARRAGAIVQVHPEVVPELGELVVLADPAGAFFGIVNPDAR